MRNCKRSTKSKT